MSPPNIVLTGFMGTGKSVVGRQLAAVTGRTFIDTDQVIQERTGRTISQIFSDQGEAEFRRLEAELAQELANTRGAVIATGGKMALDPVNAIFLSAGGPIFCLQAEPQALIKRISKDHNRPLLEDQDPESRINALLSERQDAYSQFPQIDTTDTEPQEAARQIQQQFETMSDQNSWLRHSRLVVHHPGGQYPIFVGRNLLEETTDLIPLQGPAVVITDEHVKPLYSHLIGPQKPLASLSIPTGEEHKNLETVRDLYHRLIETGLDRAGTILSLGGGVVGDVAGFVASTYMRGVGFLQCPTTLLSIVDASLGGKTGVDLGSGKNLVGAFKQPIGVISDLSTLESLPADQLRSGMAEVVKHGLLASSRLLEWIEDGWWLLNGSQDQYKFQALVVEAVAIKQDVVQEDPFEQGRRAILNLGHTFAHALESVSGFRLGHGNAVAIGLCAAAHVSRDLGYCDSQLPLRTEQILNTIGLPTRIPESLPTAAVFDAMRLDKKKEAGRLRFILLLGIGQPFIASDVPKAAVIGVLDALR